jgi:hypothetical protein
MHHSRKAQSMDLATLRALGAPGMFGFSLGSCMAIELKKVDSVELRSIGLDEKWLQEKILDDPSLLGLGELEIVSREHRQPVGGRIDFLMRNAETESYYEIEVMLGRIDESHIIRTIEYWDIERQRRPQSDHFAVIVAENITSRFFNVLRLLNRAVPMIAVQLNAFRLADTEIALHAVTVLNVNEETAGDVDVDPAERTDRAYWERKSSPGYLAIIDKIAAALRQEGFDPRLTYNRSHVALGTTGYNFCWFYPRKLGNCHIESRFQSDARDAALADLQQAGIDASPVRTDHISIGVNASVLDAHLPLITDVLKRAEKWSNR